MTREPPRAVAAGRLTGPALQAHRRPDPGVDDEDEDDTTPIGDPDDDEGYEDDEEDDDEPLEVRRKARLAAGLGSGRSGDESGAAPARSPTAPDRRGEPGRSPTRLREPYRGMPPKRS